MTDFYTLLEQQLVASGHRRRAQGRAARAVAGRGRAILAATAAVAVLAAGAAVALPSVFDTASSTSSPAAPPAVRPAPPPARARSLAGIQVAVLNGTTRTGMARAVADQLERLHADIVSVGTALGQDIPRTIVVYRRGARAQARRVAAALGAVAVQPSGASNDNRVVQIAVFVGLDRLAPAAPATAPTAPTATPATPATPAVPAAKPVPPEPKAP